MTVEAALVFIGTSLILVKSASYSVKSIISIARYFHISEFFITFFVAGLVSIMPELFIGVNSALAGTPEIGLGTLIGSNIADLTLIVGVVALVGRRIKPGRGMIDNNVHFLIATSIPVLLLLDGYLSRTDGLLLVATFIIYVVHSLRKENAAKRKRPKNHIKTGTLAKNSLIFIVSMVFVFIASHLMVESAVMIFDTFMIPAIIAGLFLISIGTTLPELTFSLRAVIAKHKQVALGDILGNVAIDSTLSIGIVAIISPITTNFTIFAVSALFMSFSALLVVTLFRNGNKITWDESFLLFFLYALFVIIQLRNMLAF